MEDARTYVGLRDLVDSKLSAHNHLPALCQLLIRFCDHDAIDVFAKCGVDIANFDIFYQIVCVRSDRWQV